MARPEPLAGVAAAVLLIAGFALLAVPPAPDAPATDVLGYLQGHRSRIFASAALVGTGLVLFLWFVTVLPPATAFGGQLGAAVVLTAMGVLCGSVLHAEAPGTALLGFDVYNALITIAGFGFALAAAGLGTRAGGLVAGLQLLTIPGLWVQSGFFAAGGAMAVLAFWALCGLFVAIALRMRKERS